MLRGSFTDDVNEAEKAALSEAGVNEEAVSYLK
jgi:hypothetical protein